MAEFQYTPLCVCGRPLKVFKSSGRPQQACSQECRRRLEGQRPVQPRNRACADCGAKVWLGSKRCKACAYKAKTTDKYQHECEQCGSPFRRVPGGRQMRLGYKSRWCSVKCRDEARTLEKRAPYCGVHGCADCGRLVRIARNRCAPCIAAAKRIGTCRVCGHSYERKEKNQQVCLAVECRNRPKTEAQKASRKRAKKVHRKKFGRKWRSIARARGVAYEPVDRIKVFDRDGWRCMICGVSAPRSRMGTNHFNAPQLDHRVPISKGGSHTYSNTQCACRRCNGEKSNKSCIGQMSLFEVGAPMWGGEGQAKSRLVQFTDGGPVFSRSQFPKTVLRQDHAEPSKAAVAQGDRRDG